MIEHPDDRWYIKRGVDPPKRTQHGTDSPEDPISNKMRQLKPTNWRQNGNRLIADTEMGTLVRFIPTDRLFTGVDKEGNPQFRKI